MNRLFVSCYFYHAVRLASGARYLHLPLYADKYRVLWTGDGLKVVLYSDASPLQRSLIVKNGQAYVEVVTSGVVARWRLHWTWALLATIYAFVQAFAELLDAEPVDVTIRDAKKFDFEAEFRDLLTGRKAKLSAREIINFVAGRR